MITKRMEIQNSNRFGPKYHCFIYTDGQSV